MLQNNLQNHDPTFDDSEGRNKFTMHRNKKYQNKDEVRSAIIIKLYIVEREMLLLEIGGTWPIKLSALQCWHRTDREEAK